MLAASSAMLYRAAGQEPRHLVSRAGEQEPRHLVAAASSAILAACSKHLAPSNNEMPWFLLTGPGGKYVGRR